MYLKCNYNGRCVQTKTNNYYDHNKFCDSYNNYGNCTSFKDHELKPRLRAMITSHKPIKIVKNRKNN